MRLALAPTLLRTAALLLAGLPLLAVPAVRGLSNDDVRALTRAREALDSGEPERALEQLATIEGGALGDHVALLRARVQRAEGDTDAAVAAAGAGLTRDPPAELRARLLHEIARIHLDAGRLVDAYKAQRRAWAVTGDPDYAAELAHELAGAFDAASLPGDALQLYRRVWTDWPLAEVSAAAFARSDELTRGTGAPPPAAYALLQRANQLRERWRCDLGLDVYDRVLARADELDASAARSAALGRAHCLFSSRRYDEAAVAYGELDAAQPQFEVALRVARAYARSGQNTRALAEFAKLRERADAAGKARCDYLSAIVLRTSQPARYHELMARVEKTRAAGGLARLARWRLAWLDVLAGRDAAALERLDKLARGSIHDIEVQRARYWIALTRRGADPAAAQRGLRELAEQVPLSYYGLVSAEHLGAEAPDPVRPFVGARKAQPVHRHAERAGWLLDAGFPELAGYELASWRRAGRLDRQQRLHAAALLHEVGDHHRAVQTVVDGFGSVLERGVDPEWIEAWQLAWPRAFEPLVRSAIDEFGFDESLVWAVMREESTYRPAVASPAGAIGLMQIIPPTGQRIAAHLGVDDFEAEEFLRVPQLNIRFGTYYLKSLVGRFAGSQPLAIAAYNAGPEAVNRWLTQQGQRETDAFVESVPYGETRRYVRRVLRSQHVYRLLDGLRTASAGPGD